MVHLRKLPRLELVDLTATGITDAGLMHLSGLPHLFQVRLADTHVTDAGVAEFQRLNPRCDVAR
ncbi:MAG: hypothetical protein U0992_10125 [Planctomycetaceae bacterium]